MTDILSRLRGDIPHRLIEDHWTVDFEALDAEREEAANEIERLQGALIEIKSFSVKRRGTARFAMATIARFALEGK